MTFFTFNQSFLPLTCAKFSADVRTDSVTLWIVLSLLGVTNPLQGKGDAYCKACGHSSESIEVCTCLIQRTRVINLKVVDGLLVTHTNPFLPVHLEDDENLRACVGNTRYWCALLPLRKEDVLCLGS